MYSKVFLYFSLTLYLTYYTRITFPRHQFCMGTLQWSDNCNLSSNVPYETLTCTEILLGKQRHRLTDCNGLPTY